MEIQALEPAHADELIDPFQDDSFVRQAMLTGPEELWGDQFLQNGPTER